jgi:hypothetical protein
MIKENLIDIKERLSSIIDNYDNESLSIISWPSLSSDTTGYSCYYDNILDVKDYGAKGNGIFDDTEAFIKALGSCVPNKLNYIHVPSGDYIIRKNLEIPQNTIISGVGFGTKLNFDFGEGQTYGNGGYCFSIHGRIYPAHRDIEKVEKGQSHVVASSSDGIDIGDYLIVTQDDDDELLYSGPKGDLYKRTDGWAPKEKIGQILQVSDVIGRYIVLHKKINLNYDHNPKIRKIQPVKNSGIENLQINVVWKDSDSMSISGVYMYCAVNCCIRNISSIRANWAHVMLDNCYKCVIKNSYFTGSGLGRSFDYSGGHAYGVDFYHRTTDCISENNAYTDLNNCIHFHLGASNNVARKEMQGFGTRDTTCGIVSFHGHYANHNVVESCEGLSIGVGDYWGPTPYNIIYNNKIRNHSSQAGPGVGVSIAEKSHGTIVANNEFQNGTKVVDVDGTSEDCLIIGNSHI